MVSSQNVEDQLKQLNCNFRLWGRAEIRELSNVLMPEERIVQATNGHYEGGFALMTATNQRLILIDRKPMFLTLEAITYDMVSEVDFHHRLLDATIRVFTLNKSLVFTSWNHHRLRVILTYTQQHLGDQRQQYTAQVIQQQSQEQSRPAPALMGAFQAATAANLPNPMPLNYSSKVPFIPRLPRRPRF